jgi:TonB family protein
VRTLAVLAASIAAVAVAKPLRIVAPGAPIAPGERLQLGAAPPAGASEREFWTIVSGPGMVTRTGSYKAPYIVPAGGALAVVRLTRGPKETPITTTAELRLKAGSFSGADSCAGPDQERLPERGEYVPVDRLPDPVSTVLAEYPASARARGIVVSVVVSALVCRSGRVLDAEVAWPHGTNPDRELEKAAVAAALRYEFTPPTSGGQPIAVWVAIPFRFPPPP